MGGPLVAPLDRLLASLSACALDLLWELVLGCLLGCGSVFLMDGVLEHV